MEIVNYTRKENGAVVIGSVDRESLEYRELLKDLNVTFEETRPKEEATGISVYNYVKRFEIGYRDLKRNLSEVRTYLVNLQAKERDHRECLTCGDKCNNQWLPCADSWGRVQYCSKCESITYVGETDRMSGANEDTIIVFKQKTNLNK